MYLLLMRKDDELYVEKVMKNYLVSAYVAELLSC